MNRNYNYDIIKCAKCSKPGEPRWKKNNDGTNYPVIPYKGQNGEEVCHKCAPCAKCGKEDAYHSGRHKYEKTNDNPSGEWVLAYCSVECFGGEKPNLPKKEPRQVENCDYCGKLCEIEVGNANMGKVFCSQYCHNRALSSLSRKDFDELRSLCCVCGFRIFGQDGNFTENFKNRKEKVKFSDANINAFYCSEVCFEKRGDKSGMSGSAWHHNPIQSDNSPKPNPAAPSPQTITNSNDKGDNSVNLGNSSRPPQNDIKNIKFINEESSNGQDSAQSSKGQPSEKNSQILIIDLSKIKQITLRNDGKLEIEFNDNENGNYSTSISQVINDEQLSNDQELQKIKNYCQQSSKNSLSQQELNNILNSNSSNSGSMSKPTNKDHSLAIGLSIVAVLIASLAVGLLLKRKKKLKRN